MKKFLKGIAVAVAAALTIAALAGCGAKKDAAKTDAPADEVQKTEKTGEAIVFGTNAEFPPFEFISAKGGVIGEFDGIDMAIAKQIAEDNGQTAEINNMEFDSLLVALQNGQIDAVIAGMTVTDERKETVDFSTPYYTATQVMIVKSDSEIAKATDMVDKNIAVIQGYTGEISVQDMGYSYQSFKKGTDAIMELVNGKADVVVIDKATAQKYVDDNENLKVVEDPEAFESEEYAIAVAKGNTELLEKINSAIEKMLADGTVNDLAAKYAVTAEE